MKHVTAIALTLACLNVFAQSNFNRIYTLMQTNCAGCHSGGSPAGGLNLSGSEADVHSAIVEVTPNNAVAAAKGDKYIDIGYPERSFLLRKVAYGLSHDLELSPGEGDNEPKGQTKLADYDIELIRQWILYGANQTGTAVNYQRLVNYYTDSTMMLPKITRPTPPPAGQGYQIHFGPIFWAPDEENEYFKKYNPRFTENLEAYKYELHMNNESHHFILRQFRPGEEANWPDALVPFTVQAFSSGKDFVNAWQTNHDLELPVGTGFFYDQNTVLDLNYHLKNYHQDKIMPGEFYLNIWTRPRGANTVEMKGELIPKLDIFIFSGQTTSFEQRVTRSGQTWNIWMLSTHTHKYGIDYDIFLGNSTSSANKIYEGFYNFDYTFNQGFYDWSHPPVRRFNPLLTVNMTNGLTHKATYHNTGSSLVTWGFTTEGEMMLIYVQYTTQAVNYKPPVNLIGTNNGCNPVELSTDDGLAEYLWSNGETTPTITVTLSGAYIVTVTDGLGATYTSDPISVTVNPLQTSINNGIAPAICGGGQLTLEAEGTAGATYLWSTGETTKTITVNHPLNYSVTVTNNGCSGYAAANVTIHPLPVVEISNTAFCSGESEVLDAGNAGASYLWSTGAASQTINVSTVGNYWVTVTDANGCAASDNAVITVHPLPNVNIADVTICTGGSAVFNAGNPGASYLWSTGATSQTIAVADADVYSVTVTTANGCTAADQAALNIGTQLEFDLPDANLCDGDTIELDAGFPGSSYSWSTGAATQTISVFTGGTYTVSVTDPTGCEGSDSGTITVLPKPVADAGATAVICSGESTVLTATGGDSYLWTTGDATNSITVSQPGSYQVTVTAANGCRDYDKVNVVVNPILTGIIAGLGSVEVGITEEYAVNDNIGSTYSWQVVNGNIISGQGTSSVEIEWNEIGQGTVTVVETNADGCDGSIVAKQVDVGSLSIAIVNDNYNIRMYPNPASSFIRIEFSNPKGEEFQINMIDVAGKTVKTIPSVTGEEIIVSRGNLTQGIYFIELRGERVMRGKVVITD